MPRPRSAAATPSSSPTRRRATATPGCRGAATTTSTSSTGRPRTAPASTTSTATWTGSGGCSRRAASRSSASRATWNWPRTCCASAAGTTPPTAWPGRRRICPAVTRLLPAMGGIPVNIADYVGATPIVQLTRMLPADAAEGVELFAKVEASNPGGSVKDRIGIAMIEAAEAEGRIEPGRTTIVEATSGNTGIALAFVCAAKGYELAIFLPQGMSREREALLKLYGARVEIVESLGGMDEAVNAARAAADGDDAFLPDQFSNPANPEAHRLGTGPEILRALDDDVDIFVAGVGTGGTITGVGEVVKGANPRAQVIAVEPASSAVLTGRGPGPHRIQGIGAGFVPAVLDREVIDEVIPVSDDDAIATAHLAAAREGVLAGISCGAALWAAIEVGKRPENQGKRIVTILPDSGERYISAPFFAP